MGQEANRKHSVNGYIMCNMPEIEVPQGARLRLILIGVGSETGMHTPGFTDLVQHTPEGPTYVVELYPGMAKVVGMNAGANLACMFWAFGVCEHSVACFLTVTKPHDVHDTLQVQGSLGYIRHCL